MTGSDVAYWDEQATSVEAARWAAWAADGWDESIDTQLWFISSRLGLLPDRPRLLDLGCGAGRLTVPAVSRFGASLVGVDPSEHMLAAAAHDAEDGNPTWMLNDGRTIPSSGFDGGWSVLTFQHLPDSIVAGYLAQLPDLLMPDARFVAQFVVGETRVPHMVERSHREIADLIADAGLSILAVDTGFGHASWSWLTVQA